MTFHAWLSTDSEGDMCYQCGTIAPVTMDGVVADYGPLPITCPGPIDGPAHHFVTGVDCIECAVCGYQINSTTLPADVTWTCPPAQESVPTAADPKVGTFACNGQVLVAGVVSGCSSSAGHYATKHMVAEALSFGWADTMAAGAVETYDDWYWRSDWPHFDHWHEIADDAEQWLNDNTEGGIWHWVDGDFRVDEVGDCILCGEPRFTNPDIADVQCGDHLSWD